MEFNFNVIYKKKINDILDFIQGLEIMCPDEYGKTKGFEFLKLTKNSYLCICALVIFEEKGLIDIALEALEEYSDKNDFDSLMEIYNNCKEYIEQMWKHKILDNEELMKNMRKIELVNAYYWIVFFKDREGLDLKISHDIYACLLEYLEKRIDKTL